MEETVMIDKKFGGTIGINLAYAAEMTEDEVKRVYQCQLVKNLENQINSLNTGKT